MWEADNRCRWRMDACTWLDGGQWVGGGGEQIDGLPKAWLKHVLLL